VEPVGLIGLGLMGQSLAERLRGGGWRVVGYDLRANCRERLCAIGGEAVGSVGEVFGHARTVLLSLPNSEVVGSVIREAQGPLSGSIIIDTTTGDPDVTADNGRWLADRGAEYLDATLTGSSALARAGELVVTAGGPAQVFAKAEPLFRLFANRWFHVGAWGSGARMKLVVNLVLGLNRAVLAEGLALARRCGLELDAVLEILRASSAYSRVMDAKGRKMIDREFSPEAKLAQHLKDVQLILRSGESIQAALPFSTLHERLLADLTARGLGECDNSAVIHAFDREGDQP
jgi:3-hydroxyisobutyrate dehydrogenase-like beta-hydroxyacid dehydrogenase